MPKVEVEGQELKLKNSHGDQVIIPKDKADWVKSLIKGNKHSEIDKYVSTLPLMSDYAADGTLFPAVKLKDKNDSRIQAYQDSLNVYNKYQKLKQTVESTNKFPEPDDHTKTFNVKGNKGKSIIPKTKLEKLLQHPDSNPLKDFSEFNRGTEQRMNPIDVIEYPKDSWYNLGAGVLPLYKKPVQPYVVDEFKDEDFKKVLKNKTNNNRIGIDSKLTKTNKTVLYPEKKIPVKYVPKEEIQVETPEIEIPKKEQISLIDSSQIKFLRSFSREIMPQEKGYDATKSKIIRYDRKGRIIKN